MPSLWWPAEGHSGTQSMPLPEDLQALRNAELNVLEAMDRLRQWRGCAWKDSPHWEAYCQAGRGLAAAVEGLSTVLPAGSDLDHELVEPDGYVFHETRYRSVCRAILVCGTRMLNAARCKARGFAVPLEDACDLTSRDLLELREAL